MPLYIAFSCSSFERFEYKEKISILELELISKPKVSDISLISLLPAKKTKISPSSSFIDFKILFRTILFKLFILGCFIFASRYIDAYYAYQKNNPVTESWEKAFKLSKKYWPIVLQHLLIGMNAHINLDLGIAAAEVMKGKDIENLKGDFDKINGILSSLVHDVESDLSEIWPTLNKILKLTGKVDDFLVNFSMELARDGAWDFAVEVANSPKEKAATIIESRDESVAKIGNLITNPGWIVSTLLKIIRLGEKGSVADKIRDMEN